MELSERLRQPGIARRLPAEWEPTEAVLMAWPHPDTDWLYILDEVEKCYARMAKAISAAARLLIICPDTSRVEALTKDIPGDRITILPVNTNDTWTRDYGPITISGDNGRSIALDFCFNAWGLKFAADMDNCVNRAIAEFGLFRHEPENNLDFVLEGGSIESDGQGTILTTARCLLSPNRNAAMDRKQIEQTLCTRLGASRILWLEHGYLAGDDTDSHIDTLARILPPGDAIAYTGCADPSDEHYKELGAMRCELVKLRTAEGKPYHLLELPLPDAMHSVTDGHRLPATYANFLIVNHSIILPTYNQPLKDKMAADILAAAMPDYNILPVDCSALVQQHGSLHCATMQIPKLTLSI